MNKEIKNKTEHNPFAVPDGYFEKFHDRLMASLPESPLQQQEKRRLRLLGNLRRWSYAAAVIVAFLVGGTVFHESNKATSDILAEEYDSEYIEELLDNYPIDDYTFYSYLTSTDTGF